METKTKITIEATVQASVHKVWETWTEPHHIIKWNFASDDWHSPAAENDLRTGGKFQSTMAAKDGSMSFDFSGTYTLVIPHQQIAYTLDDGRTVQIHFAASGKETKITETFEAEATNPIDMQRMGWQAILNNFKKYTESLLQIIKVKFEVEINAPVEKVYTTMLNDAHYRTWTAAFHEGSYFEGNWAKDSRMLFLGPDQHGNIGGMVARVAENTPNKFVSIQHLGFYQNGKEITSGPEVEGWAGAFENYTFQASSNGTLLSVEMDTNQEFKEMFENSWPSALKVLKNICEN